MLTEVQNSGPAGWMHALKTHKFQRSLCMPRRQ